VPATDYDNIDIGILHALSLRRVQFASRASSTVRLRIDGWSLSR
jgi:hypothetical protein